MNSFAHSVRREWPLLASLGTAALFFLFLRLGRRPRDATSLKYKD